MTIRFLFSPPCRRYRVLFLSLLVAAVVMLFVGVPALSSQTRDLRALVLVNSANATGYDTNPASPGEYQRTVERYFDHLQIPYRVLDVSVSAPPDLSAVQLIVAAHRGLKLSSTWQQAILTAVSAGTGLVNLDNDPGIGANAHIRAIFGATGSAVSTQKGFAVVVPATVMAGGSTPHWIAALQQHLGSDPPGDLTYPFHYDDYGARNGATATNLLGVQGTVVAQLDSNDPLIVATTYKAGRAVYFSTYDYLRADRFGFVMGFDDMFWRSLVWAARKPFVVRGYPRFFSVQMDDANANFPDRLADLWDTSLTGKLRTDGTGGPWKVSGNFSLNEFTLDPTDRAKLIAGIAAGVFQIGPHAIDIDVPGGDFYWNGGAPNTDAQWTAKLKQILTWKAGHGGSDAIPSFSRSMVPHWHNLSNNAGYDMWHSLGQRYITTIQAPGVYFSYEAPCKTGEQRLMLRPYRLYELPPDYCQPVESYPVYYADDLTVGSTTGFPTQKFYAFATYPPDANLFPQPSNWSVAQSLESFERNTWRLWSGLAPFELFTHDYQNFDYSPLADRQELIRQFSAWLNTRGVRHVFMEQLGDYFYARNKSALASAQATSSGVTLTFTGRAMDPDGNPVGTKALVFYDDSEGTWVDVPGFANGSTVIVPNAAVPSIALGSSSIQFAVKEGGTNPPPQNVSISNAGGGTLNWSAASATPWLTVTPTAGINGGTLALSVRIGNLPAGTYAGTVTITASNANNTPQKIAVSLVISPKPVLSAISVIPISTSIAAGSTQQFTATGIYSDGSTQNLTNAVAWTSSSTAIASISSAGAATGRAKGTTMIRATLGSTSGTAGLNVTAALISIAVSPATASLAKGLSVQLAATGKYSDGSTQDLTAKATWTSVSSAIASVSATGKATGNALGTTGIQAAMGAMVAFSNVTVVPAVLVSIAVVPANASIPVGTALQFAATASSSDGSTQSLTSSTQWSSSNHAVASISSTGLVTAIAGGSTTIQATYGTLSGSTTLTVASPLPGLVAAWRFDEGSGATASDSTGNGHVASLINGVTWVPGKIGNAVLANGENQYIALPILNLSSVSAATVALWVNRTYSVAGGHTLLEATPNFNASETGFAIFPDDASCGAIMVALRGDNGYSANCYAQPSSGVWHHLTAVFDKTKAGTAETAFYIDGILQTPFQNYIGVDNTNGFGQNALYLFSRGGTSEFNAGAVDDLQIFNRALSSSEVQQLFTKAGAGN